MMRTSIPESFINFGAKLGHLEVKKPSNNDLSTYFWNTQEVALGDSTFYGGKVYENEIIQAVPETRQ